ncbi:MAG: hypothetical protein RMJ97_02430 [Raineya sp.]|nr:hypothetical protein [Raineya sp.]MDW8295717.1 hypothetical protein [Raineya sp.]
MKRRNLLYLILGVWVLWHNCQIPKTKFLETIPMALPATEVTNISFKARWQPLKDATAFFLDVATDINFQNILPNYNNKIIEDTTHIISGLDIGATYYYRVRAQRTDNTISANSNTISVTLTSNVPAPVAYEAVNRKALKFVAVWSKVDIATSYSLQVALDANFTNVLAAYNNINVLDTFLLIKHLDTFESTFYYRVRANRLNYSSPYSNVITVQPAISPNCRLLEIIIDNPVNTTLGDRQIYTYDSQGRISSIEHRGKPVSMGGSASNEPLGNFVNTGYGNVNNRRHVGATWHFTYDSNNRITQVLLTKNYAPNLGMTLESRVVTYNSAGQIVQVIINAYDGGTTTNYVRRRWEFDYDSQDRVIEWRDYDINVSTLAETLAGRYQYTYNNYNLPVSMTYTRNEPPYIPNGGPSTAGTYLYTYKYDENLNPLALLRRKDYAIFALTTNMPRYKPMIPISNVVEEFVGITFTPNYTDRTYVFSFGLNAKEIATRQFGIPEAVYVLSSNCN